MGAWIADVSKDNHVAEPGPSTHTHITSTHVTVWWAAAAGTWKSTTARRSGHGAAERQREEIKLHFWDLTNLDFGDARLGLQFGDLTNWDFELFTIFNSPAPSSRSQD